MGCISSCIKKKRNKVGVEPQKKRRTSSLSLISPDHCERNASTTSVQHSSPHPPPSPVKCSTQSGAEPPSLPAGSPPRNTTPVNASTVVSQPGCLTPPNPLDRHGETSPEETTVITTEARETLAAPTELPKTPSMAAVHVPSMSPRCATVSSESPLLLLDHFSPKPQGPVSATKGQIFSRTRSNTQLNLGKKIRRDRGESRDLINLELLGLPNIGNSCFLNATLQCLLFLPLFFKEILRQENLWRLSPTSNLLSCLSEVHQSCQHGSGTNQASKWEILMKVKYSLLEQDMKYMEDSQQDAHELLLNMLCQLTAEGRILAELSVGYICPVSQLEFMTASGVTCNSCGRKSSTKQEYNHLSLDISPERTLQGSLALYFKKYMVDFRCHVCKGLQASKMEQFQTLPRVLVLHLKRFGGYSGLEKLETPISIPPNLRLSELCGDTVPPLHNIIPEDATDHAISLPGQDRDSILFCSDSNDQGPGKVWQKFSVEEPVKTFCDYQLTGIVSHLGGSMMSGHYVSDVLGASGQWLCCNDSQVSVSSEASVLRSRARSSYLLFYTYRTGKQKAPSYRA
ncbi:ubiquitin carboxyl-terminal hydrolase 37-like isoform X1 [Esox lucius]|uniref:Ubiquitin carboxyl-terminal hydrolase n=1 Tax=Esox lucius TaxID=8010 RepID=A0AAY5K0A7_ESOLU|nr:ubiquitin carboxyl-terminal hydrolase 37-like isoform X1 [Esox lucius]